MSAVLYELVRLGDWELGVTARQGKEGEALYHANLTGLGGAVAVWPKGGRRIFPSRQALLDFWEPVVVALPSPTELQAQVLSGGSDAAPVRASQGRREA